jgi:hypothetical protein
MGETAKGILQTGDENRHEAAFGQKRAGIDLFVVPRAQNIALSAQSPFRRLAGSPNRPTSS